MFSPNPAQTQGIHRERVIFQWFSGPLWNIACSKQIWDLLTAVYSLEFKLFNDIGETNDEALKMRPAREEFPVSTLILGNKFLICR